MVQIVRLGDRRLYFVDGVRVFGALSVHLGHLYLFSLAVLPTKYGIEVALTHKVVPALTASGLFMVDTFFFTSGFLMAYTLMPVYAISCFRARLLLSLKLIIKRWFRLSGILIPFLVLAAMGPLAGGERNSEKAKLLSMSWYGLNGGCKDYWISTLFFYNNIAKGGRGFECIGWTWYLSNEFQFFLYALVLFTILSKPKAVAVMAIITLGLSTVYSLEYLMSLNKTFLAKRIISNLEVRWNYFFFDVYDGEVGDFMSQVYMHPIMRVGPYLIGLLLGIYILGQRSIRSISTFFLYRHYIEWFSLIGCIILIYSPLLEDIIDQFELSEISTVLYYGLCHTLWALLLCPVYIKLYLKAHRSILWRFLADNRWVLLSRISYAWYHAHIIILITMVYYSLGTLRHCAGFGNWLKWGLFTIPPTLVLAYFLNKYIEEPFKKLGDRLLFCRRNERRYSIRA